MVDNMSCMLRGRNSVGLLLCLALLTTRALERAPHSSIQGAIAIRTIGPTMNVLLKIVCFGGHAGVRPSSQADCVSNRAQTNGILAGHTSIDLDLKCLRARTLEGLRLRGGVDVEPNEDVTKRQRSRYA